MQNKPRLPQLPGILMLVLTLGLPRAALAGSLAPAAAPPQDAAVVKASDTLTRIEAETLVLKARERQLGVQAAIMTRQNEIAAKQDESERLVKANISGNPVVQSVEGIGANKYATLELDNGSEVDVRSGDVLANGMKIVAIQPNAVLVETAGKKRIRLNSAASAPAPFNPAFPSAGISLPPLFPGLKGGAK
jgi:type IV pilus biogenesis protein PilP